MNMNAVGHEKHNLRREWMSHRTHVECKLKPQWIFISREFVLFADRRALLRNRTVSADRIKTENVFFKTQGETHFHTYR